MATDSNLFTLGSFCSTTTISFCVSVNCKYFVLGTSQSTTLRNTWRVRLPATVSYIGPVPAMTQDLACAACLSICGLPSFPLIGSNHTPSFNSSISCMFANVCQRTFFACLIRVLFMSSGHVSFIQIILPSLVLKTYQLATVVRRSFISQKTAPARPLISSSFTCLFHASRISSVHCPVQTACAQKHVAADANSCSISRLDGAMEVSFMHWSVGHPRSSWLGCLVSIAGCSFLWRLSAPSCA